MSAELRRYLYQAVDARGARIADEILAVDQSAAIAKLAESGLTAHRIRSSPRTSVAQVLNRKSEHEIRVFALRQLATMAGAGVELLEAVEILIEVTPQSRLREDCLKCAAAIRRGDPFYRAFSDNLQGFPAYVHALIRAGDASGQFSELLKVAADELAYEHRIRTEMGNALAYPMLLLCAGTLILGILFYSVVPEFAKMLGPQIKNLGFTERLIFAIGVGVREHGLSLALFLAAGALGVFSILRASPKARDSAVECASSVPFVRELLSARWRMNWARILSVSLQAGIEIMLAAELAETALRGSLKRKMVQARVNLRNGQSVDRAFSGAVDAVDSGLLKVGQKTGALGAMCGHVAQRHEAIFRGSIRRFNALLEPVAIGLIALAVGAVALSLVSAMTSLYETIS